MTGLQAAVILGACLVVFEIAFCALIYRFRGSRLLAVLWCVPAGFVLLMLIGYGLVVADVVSSGEVFRPLDAYLPIFDSTLVGAVGVLSVALLASIIVVPSRFIARAVARANDQ